MGLGLGREAGVLAGIADQDSPGRSDEARALFLRAAASVLTDDPEATDHLADARIGNTDEAALWRAIDLARRQPANAEAARAIAERLKLLLSYPLPLRRQLLGDAALSIASGGDQTAMALVEGLGGDAKVALAQAIEARETLNDGRQDRSDRDRAARAGAVIARFDRLAAAADPAVAVRAVEEAVSMRLDRRQLTPGQAADRLEAEMLDARMAGQELALHLRVADLRAQQRDWPKALADLREILRSFPAASVSVGRAAAAVLEQVSAPMGGSAIRPTDPVTQLTLLEGNQDLLPRGAGGAAVSIDLAKRLAALDLPDRAANFLRAAMTQTTGRERAQLGLELARLQLDQGDATGAVAALAATEASGLSPEIEQPRALLQAQVLAASGDAGGALKALASLRGVEADDLRVRELAATRDWAGEADALAKVIQSRLPASGPLDAAGEDLVLRLVGAAAHGGAQDTLHRLETTWAPRFPDTARRDMLRLLTASRIATVGDLSRSAADLTATRHALTELGRADTDHHG